MLDSWILPLLGGGMLGALFFGGLWYTVIHGMKSSHPAVWFLVSLVVRMTVVSAGFVFLSAGHWERLVSCLAGFLLARVIALQWLPAAGCAAAANGQGGHPCV